MKTKWSHLPNAGHIDRVLASVKAHPEEWMSVMNCTKVSDADYDAVRVAAHNAAGDAAYYAAYYAAGDAAWDARYAILALIAYDDSAQYLDMPSDKLKVWAILSENQAAVLLLPAVVAFEKIAELEIA